MIQANEIRIGNIVTVDNPQFHPNLKDVPMVIKGIFTTERDYAVKLEHQIPSDYIFTEYSQLIQFIKPIPLTEEILLKAGFKKEREDNKYGCVFLIPNTKYIIRIVNYGNPQSEDFGYSLEISDDKDWCSIKRIYYMHDLQNTIFALTGEEIKIEL